VHNRRDQVNAHGFMVGRLVSALLRAEPDLASPPMRRSWAGMVIGLILAVLAVIGFAMFGLIYPGGATAWRKPGTLILEKDTGTRFVLVGGQLRPVLNYASARLLLGAKLTVDSVSSRSLDDVSRGRPVGIPGAPDALPVAGESGSPWLVCATAAPGTSGPRSALTLAVGSADGFAGQPLADGQAILVRTPDGTTYLVTGGHRLRVTAAWVTRALGFTDDAAIGVRDGFVNTLPPGPDLPQPAVTAQGTGGPALDGRPTKVGEVFASGAAGTGRRFYILTADGLRATTQTVAALTLSDPATKRAYGGATPTLHDLSPAALAGTRVLPEPAWESQLPPTPPSTDGLSGGRMPCVRVVPAGGRVATAVVTLPMAPVTDPAPPGAQAVTPASGDARSPGSTVSQVADQVRIAPRAGLLARTLPVPGMPGAGIYLVTEDGSKFPVANDAAASALGFKVSAAVPVPADLLALIPTGPVLQTLGGGG
jgi:type VII secretion protein EccB